MIQSRAQQRFMFAHAKDDSPTGMAAREYIQATPPGTYAGLPDRVSGGVPQADMRVHVLRNMMNRKNNGVPSPY